jgi:hypothetical protein
MSTPSIFFKSLQKPWILKLGALKPRAIRLITFLHLFNLGCIHTRSHERSEINLSDSQVAETQWIADIEIKSVVYRPSKLPLSDFFARLSRGEFKDAFQKLDLDYKQSNANDKAMIELIDHGYIPAYVVVKNDGNSDVTIDEKNFSLMTDVAQVKAFYSEQLPREFQSLNPSAVAANVYNTGVVVVGFVAVIAVFVMAALPSGWAFPEGGTFRGLNDTTVLNNTNRTTNIEYKDYLIYRTHLKPGESLRGLLFFKFDSLTGIHNYKLVFSNPLPK